MYHNEMETINPYATGILAGIGVIILITVVILLAVNILTIVGQWKTLKKAGKSGWEALIPGYRLYVLCEISGLNPWWSLVYILGTILLPTVPVLGPILSTTLAIYFNVIFCLSISRSFGKKDAFAIGLWFLAPIFWILLGSNDVQYTGPKPIDPLYKAIFDKEKTQHKENNQNGKNEVSKFCTECGTKISSDVKYCPNCGKEIEK